MKPQAKLQTIAESCRLSVSTVSRILSGKTKRSRHTNKVMEVASRLGYIQPGMAPFERVKPYYTLIAHFAPGEFFTALHYGFSDAAETVGARLFIFRVPEGNIDVIAMLEELAASGMKGAILLLPELGPDDYHNIVQNKPEAFPIISISPMPKPVIDTVIFDSYGAGYQVADYFKDKGRTKLGVVKGPTIRSDANLRYNGFADHIQQLPEVNLLWEFQGDYSYNSGVAAAESFFHLNIDARPNAVFFANDEMMIGFTQRSHQLGIKIPDEVLLVGFDNIPTCSKFYPTLSSVKTDFYEQARIVLQQLKLLQESEIEQPGKQVVVPIQIVERASSSG